MIKIIWPLKIWSFCEIKRDKGLVAIIQMQNDPFFDSLWPFCMIKKNLALKNLVILHSYRTKRTKFCYAMSIDFKRCKNTEPARSQKIELTMQKMIQFDGPTRAWFPFGPNNKVFFAESVVGEQPSTTNRIPSRGSPHNPTMRSRPCDPTARSLLAACPRNYF